MTRLETLAELVKLHRSLVEDRASLQALSASPYQLGNAIDELAKRIQEVLTPSAYGSSFNPPPTPSNDIPF